MINLAQVARDPEAPRSQDWKAWCHFFSNVLLSVDICSGLARKAAEAARRGPYPRVEWNVSLMLHGRKVKATMA